MMDRWVAIYEQGFMVAVYGAAWMLGFLTAGAVLALVLWAAGYTMGKLKP